MDMNATSKTDLPGSKWDLLGELELPLSAGQNHTIHEWLNPVLDPLKLHEDLVHKVETSLRDAALRAFQSLTDQKMAHVHLRIHVPSERTSKGHNWGFFRIEKVEQEEHAVELYLYLEAH